MDTKDIPKWTYNLIKYGIDIIVNSVNDMPKDTYGFVYYITFKDGSSYIGKKNIYKTVKKPFRKDGKPRENRIDVIYKNTGKGFRQGFEVIQEETNWREYKGSSKECKDRIPDKKRILYFGKNSYDLTYMEARYQFLLGVLCDGYLNNNILGKFYTLPNELEYDSDYIRSYLQQLYSKRMVK